MSFRFFSFINKFTLFSLIFSIIFSLFSFSSYADNFLEEAEQRKFLPIESNDYENWPQGPSIGAQAAILMDANTGSILYAKNIHEKLFPASITKLLTTYIAVNKCDPDEIITFSEEAINSIKWWEDANMGVNPGTKLPLKDVLSGILIGSANEAAYAVAEHISGNVTSFGKLMNETAASLGCINSNFITPNGIHDENHYTTAYDMALIAKAFFSNELLSQLSSTLNYSVPVNSTQNKEGLHLSAKSQLLPGKAYAYEYLVGTKTGYTSSARQTLVSCASKDGMKLICVILKEENPYQFTDTIDLFNYGFNNFSPVYLKDHDNPYSIENKFFSDSSGILGNHKTILSLNSNDYILLPNTLTFKDLTSSVSYDNNDQLVCTVNYSYKEHLLGKIGVFLAEDDSYTYSFGSKFIDTYKHDVSNNDNIIFINIFQIIIFLIVFLLFIIAIVFFKFLISEKLLHSTKKKRTKRKFYSTKKFK